MKLLVVFAGYIFLALAIYTIVGGYFYAHSDGGGPAFRYAQFLSFVIMWLAAVPIGLLAAYWLID